jgi:hypothetical protein
MTNRIRRIEIRDHVLNPVEAEVWVQVFLDRTTESTKIRGRLAGPTCDYASTVVVSYPLRPHVTNAPEPSRLSKRVVIPEPSWWEPVSPFLYQGSVELWEDEQLCEQVEIRHGFRVLRRQAAGFSFNGRPLTVRGVRHRGQTRAELLQLREAGINTIVAAKGDEEAILWDMTDRLGFLVIGKASANGQGFERERSLSQHISCFGWLLDPETQAGPRGNDGDARLKTYGLCGIALQRPGQLPHKGIDFVLCDESLAKSLLPSGLPVITSVRTRWNEALAAPAAALETRLAGWIYEP